MKKAFALLLITMMAVGLFAGCSGASGDMGGEDVIKVNDSTLTKNYVDARINQIFKQNQLDSDDTYSDYYKGQVINGLVETELMVQEAQDRGIEVTDDEKADYKQQLIDTNYGGSEEDFQAYLDEYEVSDEMFDRMESDYLYYQKLLDALKSDVTVDAQSYYNENSDQFDVGDQVEAAHILVDDEDTAKDIIKQLDDGADFAELAKEYSKDTATASQGGELGYFTADQMVKEFSDAAFALEVGQYTEEPVETTYGYHVILCEDKRAAHHQTFDEVKDDLTETLTNQEVQTEYNQLIADRKADSTIEYLSDDYNPDLLIQKVTDALQQQSEESATSDDAASEGDSSVPAVENEGEGASDDASASEDAAAESSAPGEALVDTAE